MRVATMREHDGAIVSDARAVEPREVARWMRIVSGNRLANMSPVDWMNTGNGGTRWGGDFATAPDALTRAAEGIEEVEGVVVGDAREIEPREVARAVCGALMSVGGDMARGYDDQEGRWLRGTRDRPRHPAVQGEERLLAGVEVPGGVVGDALQVEPVKLPARTIAYIDPPYVGTTGYAHDLGRDEVVRLALAWEAAGAWVVISEAEALPELRGRGWHACEISGERVGQKRTFSKQQAEWLTMSRPPVVRQPGLFGVR